MKQNAQMSSHSGVALFFCPGACPTADLNRPIRRHTMLHHTGCDFLPFSQDPSVPTLWCAFSAPSIPLSGDILLKMPCLTHLLVSHYIAVIFLSSFTDDIWIAGATDQEKWPPEGMTFVWLSSHWKGWWEWFFTKPRTVESFLLKWI